MPEQNARDILACNPDFRASLWGDDGAPRAELSDDHIRDLDIQPGWPIADSTGIAAEFIARDLYRSELDEEQPRRPDLRPCLVLRLQRRPDREYTTGYFADWY